MRTHKYGLSASFVDLSALPAEPAICLVVPGVEVVRRVEPGGQPHLVWLAQSSSLQRLTSLSHKPAAGNGIQRRESEYVSQGHSQTLLSCSCVRPAIDKLSNIILVLSFLDG